MASFIPTDHEEIETQEKIGAWASQTFNHTAEGIALHLMSEAVELCIATGVDHEAIRDSTELTLLRDIEKEGFAGYDEMATETADIVILARTMAHFIAFDLERKIAQKMAINRARTWGKPNIHGYTEHI